MSKNRIFQTNLRLLPQWPCSKLIAKNGYNTSPFSVITLFTMWLCSNSHQEVIFIFPILETGLALWLTLANRMKCGRGVWVPSLSLKRLCALLHIFWNPVTTTCTSLGYPVREWKLTCRRAMLSQQKSSKVILDQTIARWTPDICEWAAGKSAGLQIPKRIQLRS